MVHDKRCRCNVCCQARSDRAREELKRIIGPQRAAPKSARAIEAEIAQLQRELAEARTRECAIA